MFAVFKRFHSYCNHNIARLQNSEQ